MAIISLSIFTTNGAEASMAGINHHRVVIINQNHK